jgi:hypothetical protein
LLPRLSRDGALQQFSGTAGALTPDQVEQRLGDVRPNQVTLAGIGPFAFSTIVITLLGEITASVFYAKRPSHGGAAHAAAIRWALYPVAKPASLRRSSKTPRRALSKPSFQLSLTLSSSSHQLTTQKPDSAQAFRRECRQEVPRTASWGLPRRGQGTCDSHRSASAKPAAPPDRHGRRSH